MSKTIAIVANSTWNIYNFRLPLIRRLRAAGYDTVVIAPVDEYIHYLNDAYSTHHIPLRRLNNQGSNPFHDLLLLWELVRIFRRVRPDLVLLYTIKPNIYGNLAARLAGIPAVSTITGLGYPFLHGGLASRVAPALYRLALRWAAAVAFHNSDDRDLFIRQGLIEEHKTQVIPGSGVNTNHFRPLALPFGEPFVFLFIGRLLADKGLREFVEAARRLHDLNPQAECWVIGEINAQNPAAVPREEVLDWVEARYIRYFGVARDVRPYLKRANALVLPSYREGLPRAILEAMAMGKPVITSDAAGCRDTVEHGRNGYLVPARNADALTDAMLHLSQLNEAEQIVMGDHSRRKALLEFDDKIITEHYLDIIRDILHEQPTEPARTIGQKVL